MWKFRRKSHAAKGYIGILMIGLGVIVSVFVGGHVMLYDGLIDVVTILAHTKEAATLPVENLVSALVSVALSPIAIFAPIWLLIRPGWMFIEEADLKYTAKKVRPKGPYYRGKK